MIKLLIISENVSDTYRGWVKQTQNMLSVLSEDMFQYKWYSFNNKICNQTLRGIDVVIKQKEKIKKYPQYLWQTYYYYKCIKRNSPNILYCPASYPPSERIILLGYLMKIPVVVRVAQGEISGKNLAQFIRKRILFKLVTAIIVLNRYTKSQLSSLNNLYFIPNGTNLKRLNNSHRSNDLLVSLDIKKTEFIILFVGSVVKRKGFDTLVKALSIIHEKNISFKLIVVGPNNNKCLEVNNHYLANLNTEIYSMGIEQNIIYTGEVDNVFPYYNICDIFVLPSLAEGMPNVLIEAMGTGCACIGTNIPGIQDVINHQVNGLLFNAGDANDLANQICLLIDKVELRNKLAMSAKTTIVNKFNIKDTTIMYQDIFNSVINK